MSAQCEFIQSESTRLVSTPAEAVDNLWPLAYPIGVKSANIVTTNHQAQSQEDVGADRGVYEGSKSVIAASIAGGVPVGAHLVKSTFSADLQVV
jgi:hypothetical protein